MNLAFLYRFSSKWTAYSGPSVFFLQIIMIVTYLTKIIDYITLNRNKQEIVSSRIVIGKVDCLLISKQNAL